MSKTKTTSNDDARKARCRGAALLAHESEAELEQPRERAWKILEATLLKEPDGRIGLATDEQRARVAQALNVRTLAPELMARPESIGASLGGALDALSELSPKLHLASASVNNVALCRRLTKASMVAEALFSAVLFDARGDGEALRSLERAAGDVVAEFQESLTANFAPIDVLGSSKSEARARTTVELMLRAWIASSLKADGGREGLRAVIQNASDFFIVSTNAGAGAVTKERSDVIKRGEGTTSGRIDAILAKVDTARKRDDPTSIARAIMREYGVKTSKADAMRTSRSARARRDKRKKTRAMPTPRRSRAARRHKR